MYYLIATESILGRGEVSTVVCPAGRTMADAKRSLRCATGGFFGNAERFTLCVEPVYQGNDALRMHSVPRTGCSVKRSGGVGIWLTMVSL